MMSRSSFRSITFISLCTPLLLWGSNIAATPPDAAVIIEARQQDFKEMGRAMKFFREGLRGDVLPPAEQRIAAAAVISRYAGSIAGWFPEGTGAESGIDTDALPYIWKNGEKFAAIDQQLISAANALQEVASSTDHATLQKQVRAVAGTCNQCHDSYRAD